MPHKCCVPGCKGNYDTGPKVKVFGFPKDEALRNAWISAVPREDLVITKGTKVCELHFTESDILRESTHTDAATGRTLTVPLSTARLRPKAVPSKFSEDLNSRKARSERKRLDAAAREKAVAESIDNVLEAVRSEVETDRSLSVTDKRQLRPRQKHQYVDAMHDEDPIETALKTSCCREETSEKASVKDQDARQRHPRKSRPRRKRPRQASSDSDYMQPDMDMFSSEEEADGMLSVKDPNFRQKRPRHTSRDSDDIQRAINESLEEADKILNLKDLADHVRKDDPKVDFLYNFLDWLDEWKGKDLDSGMLTSETHAALQHTTHALVEVASRSVHEFPGRLRGDTVDPNMPLKCSVPGCRGNYTRETKARVFKFPHDQELRAAWIRAIPQKDFVPLKCSTVCELHFTESDILRESTHTDFATGRFLDWLDEWKGKDLDSGTLTSDTHAALQHTTHALVEVARYCFTELKLSFILLGKIQTDNLEERFGNSKRPAGPRYHNSIRQFHEDEDKLPELSDVLKGLCGCDSW
ncbi:uncharacterized protein ISCGN_011010 [Ixodes scapularis]